MSIITIPKAPHQYPPRTARRLWFIATDCDGNNLYSRHQRWAECSPDIKGMETEEQRYKKRGSGLVT
jgi:hypothetical protein